VAQPVRALRGYQRVALSEETRKVKFELMPSDLAIWNDRNEFAVEATKVSVWMSPDSTHGSEASLKVQP